MKQRRFVNLVTQNWVQQVYSLHCIDPYDHFFYGSTKAAIEAADEAAEKKTEILLQLPTPSMNFVAPVLDMFALFSPRAGSEGKLVYTGTGKADMYDADRNALISLGRLKSSKGFRPMCMSVAHPGMDEDSMYVLDMYPGRDVTRGCFEVLEPTPMRELSMSMPPWRWRLLPPPPFIRQPGYKTSSVTSFSTMVRGKEGCPTIYVSFANDIGTYSFEAAHPTSSRHLGWTPSEEWSHVGEWKLPFDGRAQYIPEFKLWFGFSPSSPNHPCAVDLSPLAMGHRGPPPTEPQTWQDLNPPEGEVWDPMHLDLVHLGDGKFLIVRSFEAPEAREQFALLTGIEMIAGDHNKLHVVKHKCARLVFSSHVIKWVL
uniref:Uncharacterized protein n=1 Tax=Avena sativa TaxID=4498 RepID=A0ACD5YUE5_AVESA